MTDDLVSTLRVVVELLEANGIEYMLVGSVAALAHGHARSTQDFDVVVELDSTRLDVLLGAINHERFYVSESAAREAIRNEALFNVLDMQTGWKVDLVPRKTRAFSQTEFSRRERLSLLGLTVWTASLEDTLLAKLEWAKLGGGSERQLEDARQLLRLAGASLDRAYVQHWAAELGVSSLLEAAEA